MGCINWNIPNNENNFTTTQIQNFNFYLFSESVTMIVNKISDEIRAFQNKNWVTCIFQFLLLRLTETNLLNYKTTSKLCVRKIAILQAVW